MARNPPIPPDPNHYELTWISIFKKYDLFVPDIRAMARQTWEIRNPHRPKRRGFKRFLGAIIGVVAGIFTGGAALAVVSALISATSLIIQNVVEKRAGGLNERLRITALATHALNIISTFLRHKSEVMDKKITLSEQFIKDPFVIFADNAIYLKGRPGAESFTASRAYDAMKGILELNEKDNEAEKMLKNIFHVNKAGNIGYFDSITEEGNFDFATLVPNTDTMIDAQRNLAKFYELKLSDAYKELAENDFGLTGKIDYYFKMHARHYVYSRFAYIQSIDFLEKNKAYSEGRRPSFEYLQKSTFLPLDEVRDYNFEKQIIIPPVQRGMYDEPLIYGEPFNEIRTALLAFYAYCEYKRALTEEKLKNIIFELESEVDEMFEKFNANNYLETIRAQAAYRLYRDIGYRGDNAGYITHTYLETLYLGKIFLNGQTQEAKNIIRTYERLIDRGLENDVTRQPKVSVNTLMGGRPPRDGENIDETSIRELALTIIEENFIIVNSKKISAESEYVGNLLQDFYNKGYRNNLYVNYLYKHCKKYNLNIEEYEIAAKALSIGPLEAESIPKLLKDFDVGYDVKKGTRNLFLANRIRVIEYEERVPNKYASLKGFFTNEIAIFDKYINDYDEYIYYRDMFG